MTSPEGTAAGFNPTIHEPNRLRICALLDGVTEAEFGTVQQRLGFSASVLSKHVAVLAEAGYVRQRRAVRDTRRRVWLSLSPEGHSAYRAHVAALQDIVAGGGGEGRTDTAAPE